MQCIGELLGHSISIEQGNSMVVVDLQVLCRRMDGLEIVITLDSVGFNFPFIIIFEPRSAGMTLRDSTPSLSS